MYFGRIKPQRFESQVQQREAVEVRLAYLLFLMITAKYFVTKNL